MIERVTRLTEKVDRIVGLTDPDELRRRVDALRRSLDNETNAALRNALRARVPRALWGRVRVEYEPVRQSRVNSVEAFKRNEVTYVVEQAFRLYVPTTEAELEQLRKLEADDRSDTADAPYWRIEE